MWNDIRLEAERARKELGLMPEQFRPLSISEWQSVEKRLYQEFTEQAGRLTKWTWPWANPTHKKPHAWLAHSFQNPATYLPVLIGKSELCYVFFEGVANEQAKFWWYEGTIDAIVAIIEEIWHCEIGIMHKRYEWLLCINHHDSCIGIGEHIVHRIQRLNSGQQKQL